MIANVSGGCCRFKVRSAREKMPQPVKGKVNGMKGTASLPSTSSEAVEGADDLKVNVLAFEAR
jgi:hypothetical protein